MANPRYPYSRIITPFYSRQPSWANWDDHWSDVSPASRLDQSFGMGPTMMDEFFNHWRNWMRTQHASGTSSYYSSQNSSQNSSTNYQQTTGASEVTQDEKEFRVRLDVNQFSPEEIMVKTVDNRILVHAKHEERQDEHGFIQREFTRQYLLPRECESNNVTSVLASDGVLTIRAPKSVSVNGNERIIPITQETTKA